MTVTREQAQLLTTLAIACRPYRAPTWDPPGVMAAIGQLRDWSLSEVALRVIVAAADREAQTPAVIASPSMRIPEPKPPLWQPSTWEPHQVCSVCSRPEARCRAVRHADDDHEFVSRTAAHAASDRGAELMGRIVTGLRDIKATEQPPEPPTPETTDAGTVAVAPARAALAAARDATQVAGSEAQ